MLVEAFLVYHVYSSRLLNGNISASSGRNNILAQMDGVEILSTYAPTAT